ncbi:uncharacterized protein BT62DRAFT_891134 [Guyanagaster necrorhizus]|uniref:Mitochondrial distribution and morphology protein 12 n=1 Tax=Guyanagaster necrorhizus TaxID=856835 RepID=A0A9P7VWN2_9AGAR|nr:uncharacterized protein BT62DRAFT_891134 [Guyanagaster necrorhizus MCA 3950]KAG7448277.1 hypothetical protein BT62DRAFT_891134 [Guyanagaster necrorhizus MCA 3950]
MSIDLEWDKLDSSLSTKLVEILNRQLTSTSRPSFIGPVEVTSLEFGSTAPDVELVDLRDIYRDFIEDDDEEKDPVKVTEGGDDDDEFEWVSRRAAHKEERLAYQQQTSGHLRYAPRTGSADMYTSAPSLHMPGDMWNPGFQSMVDFRPGFTTWPNTPGYRSPTKAAAPVSLHFSINWNSDLRITLTTSLLINYPSPMFMSLPIKLSVTGLIFTGEIAVAYEGECRRVHLCILDELDPYGPAGDRPKRDPASSTPPELDDDSNVSENRLSKPLPIGQRLLPSIYIESEIGQTDKHVLKNVTRVERFIQDVIRKTVEEELVFPNFHTLIMSEP